MKLNILSNIIISILIIGLCFSSVFAAPNTKNNDFIDILIGFDNIPGPVEHGLIKKAGGSIKHSYTLVPGLAASVPAHAIEGLKRNPRIKTIEPDGMFWAISYEAELDNSWGVKHIQAGDVHNNNVFGEGINVAVIDTGIDYKHSEFYGLYKGGYDFVNNDNDPMDDHGHGTHVAGTIAAIRDGKGVVGVAPKANLYGLKVLNASGGGSFSDIIKALEWAVENGINITNNSYGSSGDPGSLVKQAFDNSYQKGVLHVAAAGNEGNPPGRGDNVIYPAKWDSVIAVAAVDKNNKRPNWSSTGSTVELSAPGVSINSTWLNDGYGQISGTSMASPHVAGTAALVMAKNNLNHLKTRQILRDTANNLGDANHYGYGLVNAFKAVGEEQNGGEPDNGESYPEGLIINVFELTNTSNPAWARVSVKWSVSDSDGKLSTVKTEMRINADSELIDSKTSSISGFEADGTHELNIRNGHGKTYQITLTVVAENKESYSKTKEIGL